MSTATCSTAIVGARASGAIFWPSWTLARPFGTCFGFTEPEVLDLLHRAGRADRVEDVRAWYNGYSFGGEVIYNPWSVLSFLQRNASKPGPYWIATSSNDLVRDLLERHALRIQPVLESLLAGGSIERVLDENVILSELGKDDDPAWSLLVFSGYLKAEELPGDMMERARHRLSIPNLEVREVYATTFRSWMKARLDGHGGDLEKLTRALLSGDAQGLEDQLQAFVMNVLSYGDPGAADPERVYQGFVLGLLAALEPEHLVRSNRESGEGRPDVTVRARTAGHPAAVLELKVARKGRKTPAAALREGLTQIAQRGYAAELLASGATAVHAFAVAFDGKRVWVKAGKLSGRSAPREANAPRPRGRR